MRRYIFPAIVILFAVALLFIPDYGVLASMVLLGFAPVIVLVSNDTKMFKKMKPDRTKIIYFLLTAIFPLVYTFFLFLTAIDPEFVSMLEPLFLAVWSLILLLSFIFYYILACFIHPVILKKNYRMVFLFIIFYTVLAVVQVFSIEISYLIVLLSQP